MADRLKRYPSIDAFYEDRGGRSSGECDFGVWNYDDCRELKVPTRSEAVGQARMF